MWTASAMNPLSMADPPLLALAGIRYRLGDQTILDGVELAIAPGERLSLVGRNGAGKSTLLRILAGEPIADDGTRFAQPGATVATLPQGDQLTGTVGEIVFGGRTADTPWEADPRPRAIPRRSPAARRGVRRWRGPWWPSLTCCCSTSPPTISTFRPSNGWRRGSRPGRVPSCW